MQWQVGQEVEYVDGKGDVTYWGKVINVTPSLITVFGEWRKNPDWVHNWCAMPSAPGLRLRSPWRTGAVPAVGYNTSDLYVEDPVPAAKESDIPGLTESGIDKDAYDDFMRGL